MRNTTALRTEVTLANQTLDSLALRGASVNNQADRDGRYIVIEEELFDTYRRRINSDQRLINKLMDELEAREAAANQE